MRGVWVLLLACGCGAAQPEPAPEPEGEAEIEFEVQAEAEAEPHAPCSTRQDCVTDARCLWDQLAQSCRSAENECERTRPLRADEPGYETVDYRRGDPCAVQNPRCAYDGARAHCVELTLVTTCPESLSAARAASVRCMHPDQPALGCDYEGHWCSCRPPAPYCGGARPEPGFFNRPTQWGCQPDLDATGCPTRGAREGERCSPEGQECVAGCSHLMQCRRGRWRLSRELPPRP